MREFKVEASVGKPQVNYRETIRSHSEAEGKNPQTGGSGNTGTARSASCPTSPARGYEFSNDIKGGTHSKEYIKPIDQGIQEAMQAACWPATRWSDVKLSLYDGSYHEVDSNEMAFKIAGSIAFKEGARKARPVLLGAGDGGRGHRPEEYMGAIIGDLNSRRGRIEALEMGAIRRPSPRHGAGCRDVRVRHHMRGHAGPRQLIDAVQTVRRGAAGRCRKRVIAKCRAKDVNDK